MRVHSWLLLFVSSLPLGLPLKLGLLPFLVEHSMMPGETRNIFLFDDSLMACMNAAHGSSSSSRHMIGGLLMDEQGEPSELSLMFRIDEIKEADGCVWAKLACVGRCLVSKVLRNKAHGFRVAEVSTFCDDSDPISDAAAERLKAVHSKVASQRRLLRKELLATDSFDDGYWESLSRSADTNEVGAKDASSSSSSSSSSSHEGIFVGADKVGRAPFGIYDSYESFEETGVLCEHVYIGQTWERPRALGCVYFRARDLGELDDEENGAELAELIATRRAVLTGDGTSSSSSLLDAVGDAWGVQSEEAAELQLLSYAAAATLSPMDRARALMLSDTAERIELAEAGLAVQRQLLEDLLA